MKTLFRMVKFLKPYWLYHIFAITASILETLAYLLMPYAFKIFIDKAIIEKNVYLVYKSLAGYFIIVLLAVVFGFLKVIIFNIINEKITKDSRIFLFKKIRDCELKKLDDYKLGTLISYLLNDSKQMSSCLGSTLCSFIQNILRMIIGIIVLGTINIKILLLLILFLPLYLLDVLVFNKPIKKSSKKLQEQNAAITENLQENLSATTEILVLNKKQWELKSLNNIFNKYIKLSVKNSLWTNLSTDLGFLIYWFVHILVYFVGSKYVLEGSMTVGTLLLYAQYMDNIYMPCKLLIQDNINIQKSIASGERFFELVDDLHSDINHNKSLRPIEKFNSLIELKNVSFQYKDQEVLKNINLKINKGEIVAVTGTSGSGKSTLLNLLLNLYNPTKGEILIDSINIDEIDKTYLYNIISVVFQDVFLFDGSIYDNIKFSKLDAEHTEVIKASKNAGADKFITNLKENYETAVGERGSKLSGGQRQRLSIARALLKNSDILIFDEPTSALDMESKNLIFNTINELKKDNKTIILVTHDLKNIKYVDKVVQLEHGEIKGVITKKQAVETLS